MRLILFSKGDLHQSTWRGVLGLLKPFLLSSIPWYWYVELHLYCATCLWFWLFQNWHFSHWGAFISLNVIFPIFGFSEFYFNAFHIFNLFRLLKNFLNLPKQLKKKIFWFYFQLALTLSNILIFGIISPMIYFAFENFLSIIFVSCFFFKLLHRFWAFSFQFPLI